MPHYLAKNLGVKNTPQTERLPGRTDQVENDAGGMVFPLDKWLMLRRFLILGSQDGSYYASEHDLTKRNIDAVIACLSEDPVRVVNELVEVSINGLAPRNDQAILVLALAFASPDVDAKALARAQFSRVVRTGTHLFMFAEFVEATSGWGRAKRSAVQSWYATKTPERLAYQLVKYRQRNGWTHRDMLRLAHPKGNNAATRAAFEWAVKGVTMETVNFDTELRLLLGFEQAQAAIDVDRVVEIVQDFNLPREALPTEALRHAKVWEALLYAGSGMPMTALIRNLPTMTRVGLLGPFTSTTKEVIGRLSNAEQIHLARVHPMQLLLARMTYAAGHSDRGKATWTPVPQIVDALDAAFYTAFANVEPSGKRLILGVDCSGSMGGYHYSTGASVVTPAMLAAAMALVTAHVEPDYAVIAFATSAKPIRLTAGMTLSDAMRLTALGTGEMTDVAVPVKVAMQQGIDADAFVIYTDNQTWAGDRHLTQALTQYRRSVQHDVRYVACGMNANEFTVVDPSDPHGMNVVGFDASAPAVISHFVAGRI